MTVKNDRQGCALTLAALEAQSRLLEQIIVVDGGSTDGTVEMLREYTARIPRLRLIEAPGVNIARGRNIAAQETSCEIIASTDSGCRPQPDWLETLTRAFDENPPAKFVAGFYRVDAHTLLEEVVGLATMRGQLEPLCPETFNPSARSMACTKSLWHRAAGWPEWIDYSEDTLFDHKVRSLSVSWRCVPEAVVHWRPRTTLRAIAKQFYHYGTGRGHTQIGAEHFSYHLRNLFLVVLAAVFSLFSPWAGVLAACLLAYWYVWGLHEKAFRIAGRTKRKTAYPLCIFVLWVVMASNLTGYLVGSWQRFWKPGRYRDRLREYLEAPLANHPVTRGT